MPKGIGVIPFGILRRACWQWTPWWSGGDAPGSACGRVLAGPVGPDEKRGPDHRRGARPEDQGAEAQPDQSGGEEEGVFIITSTPGTDVRDGLARQIVDGGYALRELRGLDMTLEDIFLRLTTEEVKA